LDNGIRERLRALSDKKYKAFMESQLPGVNNIMGVRMPELQRLALELAKKGYDAAAFFDADLYEEILLRGLVIGRADMGREERISLIAGFIPKIDNWAVCDSFSGALKFVKKNRERVREFLGPYIVSDKEFEARFAAVMMLIYYTDGEYFARTIEALKCIKHEGYYAKMAVAWAYSVIAAEHPEETFAALSDPGLDGFVKSKAIQKMIESRRVDPAVKQRAREMRK
jgi:3-methyladenine DNA glycosylase AlkD